MIRLTHVRVDAFRGLKDRELDLAGTGSALTVLLGPNEAGKSTLLEFIRQVLFGTAEARGSVTMEAAGQRYRVEASGSGPRSRKVTDLESGEPCPPTVVGQLLGAVDERTFRNVFAFGLTELQSLGSLTDKGVQDRIFSAGVAGAGPSARGAIQELSRQTDELLRPRANSRMKAGADAYQELRDALRDARQAAAAYGPKSEELAEVGRRLQADREALEAARGHSDSLNRLQQAWPHWLKLQDARARLSSLPDAPPVSADLPAMQELARSLRRLEGEVAEAQGERAALPPVRPERAQARGELEEALGDLKAHEERARHAEVLGNARTKLVQKLAKQRQDLPEALRSAGLEDWTAPPAPALEAHERALEHSREGQRSLESPVALARERLASGERELRSVPAPAPLSEPAATPQEDEARQVVAQAHARLQGAQAARNEELADAELLPLLPTLQSLHGRAPRELALTLPARQAELAQQRAAQRDQLAGLGDHWTAERVAALDPTAVHAWRTEGGEHARVMDGAARQAEEASRTLQQREAARQEAELTLSALPEGPQPDELEARRQELRGRLALAAKVRAELQAAQAPVPVPAPAAPVWKLWASLALTALLAALTLPNVLLAGLVLAAGLALSFLQRPVAAAPVAAPPVKAVKAQDLERLGLAAHAGVGQVAALESELNLELGELQQRELAAAQRGAAERARSTATTLEGSARAEREIAGEHQRRAEQAFTAWAAERELSVSAPAGLESLLLRLASARDAELELRSRHAELRAHGEQCRAFLTEVQGVLGGGLPDLPAALDALEAALFRAQAAQAAAQRQQDQDDLIATHAGEVQRAENNLSELRRHAQERHDLARQRVEEARREFEGLLAQQRVAEAAVERAKGEWRQWLSDHGLPATEPATVRVTLERLQRAADTARSLREQEEALAVLNGQLQAYLDRVETLTAPLGGGGPGDLRRLLDEARAAEHAARQHAELQQTVSGLESRRNHTQRQLSDALAATGAPDLGTLERWSELNRERRALEERVEAEEQFLKLAAGQDEERLRGELEGADPEHWEEELRRLSAESQRLTASATEGEQAAAGLRHALECMQSSETVALLQLRLEAQRQRLQADLRAWAVLRLAGGLLDGTLREYERTKGPEVLRHASEVFRQVTESRYHGVRQLEGSTTMRVIDSREEPVDIESLSRGTQEQLYLAIRLGLARTLGQRTAFLPMLMDDVLVNADPGRARAVADALAAFARSHQVLYLTCHPANAELLQQADGDARVIELPRLGRARAAPVPALLEVPGSQVPVAAAGDDVRNCLVNLGSPMLFNELRSALPNLSENEIRQQLAQLERGDALVKTGQRRGMRYALA